MGPSPRALASAAVMALLAMAGTATAASDGDMEVLRWLTNMETAANDHRKLQLISAINQASAVATGLTNAATTGLTTTTNNLASATNSLLSGSSNGVVTVGAGVNTASGLLNAFTGAVGVDPSISSATSTASTVNVAGLPQSDGIKRPKVAPDTTNCANMMQIDVQSFTEYRLYLEGEQVGYSPGVQYQTFFQKINYSDPVTIAIEATRDPAMPNFNLVDGIYVNVTVCNRTFISDFNWVCTDTRPWSNNWRKTNYPIDKWMQAAINREMPILDAYTPHAYWIWTKSCASSIGPAMTSYCRATIDPKCKTNCGPAPAKDYSCFTKCTTTASATASTCDQVAARLKAGCKECPQSAIADLTDYCKTSGCTAAQCKADPDPAPTPDTSCAASCNSGVSTIRESCDQQKYMFNSGCLSQCGPEAFYYLKQQCMDTLKCSPEVCQYSNVTAALSTTGGMADSETPAGTAEPTPDLTCFAGCLRGMNSFTSYCDKIHYALTQNCNRCSADVLDWAHRNCLTYSDPNTGATCTAEQCG